jgi:hypothetical protein
MRNSSGRNSPRSRWGMGVDPGQSLPPEAIHGPWKNLRAAKEKKVFDIQCHAYGSPAQDPNVKGRTHNVGKWQDHTNELIAAMDRHGIAQAALNPAYETYETIVSTDVTPHLDRFVRVSGMPTEESKGKDLTPQMVAEIYQTHLERDGCVLIGETAGDAWTSMLRQRKYTAKDLKPMADVVMEHDVPVQMQTGWSATVTRSSFAQGYPTAWHWAEDMGAILTEYPDIKFIVAHTGGDLASPDGREAARLAFSFDNLYVDTSKTPAEIVSEVVRGIGAERVLFGSDWNRSQIMEYGPFQMRAAHQYWWNLNTIANADLTEDQRDWILYKSARKLLKLPLAREQGIAESAH